MPSPSQPGPQHLEYLQRAQERIEAEMQNMDDSVPKDTPEPRTVARLRMSVRLHSADRVTVMRRHTAPEFDRTPSLISPSPLHGMGRGQGPRGMGRGLVTPVLPRQRSLDSLVRARYW
jgi:hypothetical protein